MRRLQDIETPRTSAQAPGEPVSLRAVDVVITTGATVVVISLLLEGLWAPGAPLALGVFTAVALGPPVLRWLASRFPGRRIFDVLASTWLVPSAILGHAHLGPVVDTLNPGLWDDKLALADLRLFGSHPSVVLGELSGPWLTEFLMISYYSYFIGPLLLGMMLYFRGRREVYEQYALALGLFFAFNFAWYIAVPAIGPRYYLAGLFDAPLQGVWLTPYLEGLMRTTAFSRDCFPSGHTGVTLIMLTFAWSHRRWFFWLILPWGVGLIAATLVGRFHYGIDLLAAVPMVLATLSLAAAIIHGRQAVPERMLRAARRLVRA
jgi:hypothetical protein